MFASFRSKTFTILLMVLLVACYAVIGKGIPIGTGNYIPDSLNSTQVSSAYGAFIVLRTTDTTGALNADGNSPIHYIQTFVGDRSLHYDGASGSSDQSSYNTRMISSIITCFAGCEIELNLSMIQMQNRNDTDWGYICLTDVNYNLPYILVVVRVSNFSSSHDSTSTDYNNWLSDPNSSLNYEVVAILDSRDPSTRTASNLYLKDGECFHIVMVPFSLSNTVYLEGANLNTVESEYRSRYQINFTYRRKLANGNYTSGSSVDYTNDVAWIRATVHEYETLSFGFEPTSSTLSITELLENKTDMANLATTMTMSYAKMTTNSSFGTVSHLSVKLYPYRTDDYYFLYSGTSTPTRNRTFPAYLKVTNIQSSHSDVTLKYGNDNTISVSSGDVIDSQQYGTTLEFLVDSEERTFPTDTYKAELDADLSFDIYPYIESTNTSLAGDYTLTVVAEFSIL